MATHTSSVIWERAHGATFTDNRYSRAHRWEFDGGAVVQASSSPAVVPAEEAFVASLSSCHMLWFLFFAAKAGFVVDAYRDQAVGSMEKTPEGSQWMSRVVLRPAISFSGNAPDAAALSRMHECTTRRTMRVSSRTRCGRRSRSREPPEGSCPEDASRRSRSRALL
jgi:organic hydroperoxide reductase OsmC/OhrA